VILVDQYTQKTKITNIGKSELKTRFGLIWIFGLRFKLWTESIGSAKDLSKNVSSANPQSWLRPSFIVQI